MTGIQLTGLASGLDTDSIISQLMAVESAGRTKITYKQAATTQRQTDLTAVKSSLAAVGLASSALRSFATWANQQSATSSSTAVADVRLTGGASPGASELTVTQLASAQQRTYAYTAQAGASTITVGGKAVDLAAGATAADAASAINGADVGVYAVEVAGRLVLGSRTTGAASDFAATGDGLAEDAAAARAGRDAEYTIDGGPPRTSASNVVTDAVAGAQVTLRSKGATTLTTSEPSPSADVVVAAVKAFVTAYDSAVGKIRTETAEKRVSGPTSAAAAAQGALYADSGLNGLLDGLRNAVDLSDLGISTGAASATSTDDSLAGKLVVDEDALRAALAAPGGFAAVRSRLTATSTALNGLLDPQTQAGGVLDQRLTSVSAEASSQADALTRYDARLASRQAQLQAQFTALETAMAKSQQLQASLFGTTSSKSS